MSKRQKHQLARDARFSRREVPSSTNIIKAVPSFDLIHEPPLGKEERLSVREEKSNHITNKVPKPPVPALPLEECLRVQTICSKLIEGSELDTESETIISKFLDRLKIKTDYHDKYPETINQIQREILDGQRKSIENLLREKIASRKIITIEKHLANAPEDTEEKGEVPKLLFRSEVEESPEEVLKKRIAEMEVLE